MLIDVNVVDLKDEGDFLRLYENKEELKTEIKKHLRNIFQNLII